MSNPRPRRFLILVCTLLSVARAQAPQPTRIDVVYPFETSRLIVPMPEAGPKGLQAMLVLPHSAGKHPLVVMGTIYRTLQGMRPEINWFASRGFAVGVYFTRGVGGSGGKTIRGKCSTGAPPIGELAEAADIRAVIGALTQNPAVDPDRILGVGVYRGALGAAFLTENPPAGYLGSIGVDLGSGDMFGCRNAWESTFDGLGRSSRRPILWVTTRDNSWKSTANLFGTFTTAGGKGTFVPVDAAKKLEPDIFLTDIPQWTAQVEPFLSQLGLDVSVQQPLPPQTTLTLAGKQQSGVEDGFRRFLVTRPSKAFALGPDGHYGWAAERKTGSDARLDALGNCHDPGCKIVVSEE